MKHLLIVYHSQTGHTKKLADAVLRGAQEEDTVTTRLLRAVEAKLEDLIWCDGLIVGTPENFGYMSGGIKDFFDRTYNEAEPLHLNIPYALFVSAGNDGTGAVREVDRIMLGYPMKKVAEPLIVRGEISASGLAAASELGLTLASGLGFGIF